MVHNRVKYEGWWHMRKFNNSNNKVNTTIIFAMLLSMLGYKKNQKAHQHCVARIEQV